MKTILKEQLTQEFIHALDELSRAAQESLLIDLHGKKFVVVKEKEYQGWLETAYLLSSSKNAEILKKALDEPPDECRELKKEHRKNAAI